LAASMSRSTSRSVRYSRSRLPTVTFTEVEALSYDVHDLHVLGMGCDIERGRERGQQTENDRDP
jgi:hypothetical protein